MIQNCSVPVLNVVVGIHYSRMVPAVLLTASKILSVASLVLYVIVDSRYNILLLRLKVSVFLGIVPNTPKILILVSNVLKDLHSMPINCAEPTSALIINQA